MSVRVVVADDQPLIRAGLVALFAAAPGIEVVGEAADGEQAVAVVAEVRPDVVLMDIRMPVLDGIAATRRILAAAEEPAPRVLVLTTFDLDEYVYAALSEGASGFLLKDTPPEGIVAAVRSVIELDLLFSPGITHRLIETYADHHRARVDAPALVAALTPRETDVLRLVGTGLTNAEIAHRLVLSEGTVKAHFKHVMAKLQLSSRAQAVVAAYESGLVMPGGAASS